MPSHYHRHRPRSLKVIKDRLRETAEAHQQATSKINYYTTVRTALERAGKRFLKEREISFPISDESESFAFHVISSDNAKLFGDQIAESDY